MVSSSFDAATAHTAIVSGRPALKQRVIAAIDTRTASIDREKLRGLLLESLRHDFKPPRPGGVEDQRHSDTRCWLLSALARVADDDREAKAIIRRHLNREIEPYEWARFWTLEGLINAQVADLRELTEPLAMSEESAIVRSLARTALAAIGDDGAADVTQKTLRDGKQVDQSAVLRSLRVVPSVVPIVIHELCAVVDRGVYADVTFDAIAAIGRLDPESQYAEKAAQTLTTFLITHRWVSYEAMRTKALNGLGNLRVARTAPVLIEELLDESPAIIHAASRALEKVLGVRMATARLLEATGGIGPEGVQKFATALRAMDRTAVVEALEAVMLTSSDEQVESARLLLSEVGGQYAFQKLRARTDAASKYSVALEQAEEKIRELFQTSIEEAQHGFRLATRMDIAVFALGIALIAVSATLMLQKDASLGTWAGVGVSGGTGVLSVLYTMLVARPRDQVRDAVDHLMYLKIVFLGYLRQLHQTDQAFTRRLLDDERLAAREITQFSDTVGSTMSAAIAQLTARSSKARKSAGAADTTKDTAQAGAAGQSPSLDPINET